MHVANNGIIYGHIAGMINSDRKQQIKYELVLKGVGWKEIY